MITAGHIRCPATTFGTYLAVFRKPYLNRASKGSRARIIDENVFIDLEGIWIIKLCDIDPVLVHGYCGYI